MAHSNQTKNMSGMSGHSFEKKHIFTGNSNESDGNESDASIGSEIQELKIKTIKFTVENSIRLGESSFDGRNGVWAKVLVGEIFADEEEFELEWNAYPTDVKLSWSSSCNLESQKGIACDNGYGWAGWDDKMKCYLRYDSKLEANEHCMRIMEIEVPPEKPDKINALNVSKSLTEEKPEKPETIGCSYIVTKGKKKGNMCGKEITAHNMCKKHTNKTKQSESKQSESKQSESEQVESEQESNGCTYVATKGKSKGLICYKPVKTGSDRCTKHENTGSTVGNKKIEISDQGSEKLSDMALQNQIKNMSDALVAKLSDIFVGTLKDKYAKKAIAVLQTEDVQEAISKCIEENTPKETKTKARKTRKRDPAAPKRGMSSYIFFCKDKRSEVKAENPNFKGTEITTELGRLWKETSDKDKKKYIKQADKDKARYETEKEDYTPSAEWLAESGSDDETKTSKTKKERKAGPIKARSAYIFFCTDMRASVKEANPDMDTKELTAELGRIWREDYKDNENKCRKWLEKAADDKDRFVEEKSNWVDQVDEDSDAKPSKPSVKKSKKSKTDNEDEIKSDTDAEIEPVAEKKSKSKTPSGFPKFCIDTRENVQSDNPTWNIKQVTEELQKLWATMDTAEQEQYTVHA